MPDARFLIPETAAAALLLAGGPAASSEFLIEVSGLPAMKFRRQCEVVNDGGEAERGKFSGTIPASYVIKAAAVSCKIGKRDAFGRLRVKLLYDGGIIAKAETRAAFNRVRVRSAGPWGGAKGIGRATALEFSLPPGSRPRLVPPLAPA
ncbi:MAG: hypothetical protein V3T27_01300, partial [Alphaproteobacteria bacterium]